MMRGFLNNSQEKAGQIGPPRCSGSENIPLFKPKLDYGVVSDAGRPEGYETEAKIFSEQETNMHPDNFHPDTWMFTSQPPMPADATLANFPDGWAECMVPPAIKKALLATPGYPQPIPRTLKRTYRIADSPGKGLAMFSTRNLVLGDLILAERPMIVLPGEIRNMRLGYPSTFTEAQKKQALLYEWEGWMQPAFKRMPEEYRSAYLELANSHKQDGSGTLLGIFRTNGFGILDYDIRLSAVCKDASRLNHSCSPNVDRRFDPRSFSFRFYAIRDIAKGEELTVAYCDITDSFEMRKMTLAPYGFQCSCTACRDPASSDPRRVGLEMPNLSLWLSDQTLPDKCVIQHSMHQMSIIEEEGIETADYYREHMRAVAASYICLADEANALIYGRKAAKLMFLHDGDTSSFEPYMTPEAIRTHPMWALRGKSKTALLKKMMG